MTTEEAKEFRDNYNILYNNFQELGQGLEDYQQKAKGTKKDLLRLKNLTVYFQDIVKTIVYEYAYKYPECKCVNSNGAILISYTITSLNREDYIDDKIAKMLRQADYYGYVNTDHINNLRTSDFLDIKDTYEELIDYMPEFLKLFPHPSPEGGRAQRERTEKQQNQTEKETQTALNNADINRDSNTKSHQKSYGRYIGIFVILLLLMFYLAILNSVTIRNSNNSTVDSEETIDEINGTNEAGIEQETFENEQNETEEKHYAIGETWTVEGQWELTIDGVSVSSESDFSNNGTRLIIIDYYYTNLGYERDYQDGLYMSLINDATVVDADGIIGTDWSFITLEPLTYPEYITIGATWAAQAEYQIHSDKNTATLTYKARDGNEEAREAVFDLSW